MFAKCEVSIFLATTKPETCLEFYTKTMGLALAEDGEYALVFKLKSLELRISKVPDFTPHPFTVLDWIVDDLDAAMTLLESNGVKFEIFKGMGQNERGVWQVPNGQTKIAWFKDPDGNVLSVSQRAE